MAKKNTPWNIPEKVVKEKAAETMQQQTSAPTPPKQQPTNEKKVVAKAAPTKKIVRETKQPVKKKVATKQQVETRVLRVDEAYHTKLKFLAIDKRMKLKAYVEELIEKEWQKSKFKSM